MIDHENIESLLAKLRALVANLEADNAHLRRENAALWDSVHELQEMNARGRMEVA